MPHSLLRPMNLFNIPVELICHIFSHLEVADLIQCTAVSKFFSKVILDSSCLQYTIELAKHRMVALLPPSASLPYATRLRMLREREKAWRTLSWKGKHTLRLPPTGSVYEFVGGLYGNGREDDSRVTASISFLELPSLDNTAPGSKLQDLKMWTHNMDDVTIIDFTMDPSQDLLILVALAAADSKYVYELHLRTISTNSPHPKAPLTVLPCLRKPDLNPPQAEIIAAVRVQVAGNVVALLIKEVLDSAGAHLEIWNWENSPQYSCTMTRISGIDDFTFLAHDTFLLVRPTGRFEVYTFEDPKRGSTHPTLCASYAFPPLADGFMYWYISMSSNPAPGYVPRASHVSNVEGDQERCKQTYYPRPDERIHACCLYIFNPSIEENHHVYSFVFFLNIRTLLHPPEEWRKSSLVVQAQPPARYPPRVSGGLADAQSDPPSIPIMTTNPASANILVYKESDPLPVDIASSSSHTLDAGLPSPTEYQYQSPQTPTYPPFPNFFTKSTPSAQSSPSPPVTTPPALVSPLISHPPSALANRSIISNLNPITSPAAVYVPWEVWGPQSTRWFEECLSTDWQHAIYGLRTVESIIANKKSRPARHLSPGVSLSAVGNGTGAPHPPTQTHVHMSMQVDSGPSSPMSAAERQDNAAGEAHEGPRDQRRLLRIRDFNPYSLAQSAAEATEGNSKGKGKNKNRWRASRLVTEPSTTPVHGVFKQDIVSWLPYTEVVSEESFEVTDVMMDDCRLLLLKRGQLGKLKRVDVLMM